MHRSADNQQPPSAWYCSPWVLALGSAFLLWAAQPPLGLWPLAWIAPLGWLLLARSSHWPVRRPYLVLWLAGFLHWLVVLQGLRLPHWTLHFGWILLALYLGLYIALFVGLTRVAVHRLGVSVVLAAPLVWTGLEVGRGYLLTGFAMGLLGHTQVHWTSLIQLADTFGAYGVSFLIMLVAACLARLIPWAAAEGAKRRVLWPMAVGASALAAALVYGQWRLLESQEIATENSPALRVALLQGTVDMKFNYDAGREMRTFEQYYRLALRARRENPQLDLIVWPESAFAIPDPTGQSTISEFLAEGEFSAPAEFAAQIDERAYAERMNAMADLFRHGRHAIARQLNQNSPSASPVQLLVGTQSVHLLREAIQYHNAALLIDQQGEVVERYHKIHRVMFGEYIPFGDVFPWIYRIGPLTYEVARGEGPQAMSVGSTTISPSICFESSVPHFIRRQLVQLRRQGEPADILVNLTNDGWFWGSNILDLHFHCGVFRAVENRRPFLVAANTGLTAWVDGSGRVQAVLPRQTEGLIVADVRLDGRQSLYQKWGDAPAGLCLLASLALVAVALAPRRKWRAEH